MWRCINRLEYGATYCKDSPTILEEHLHSAILKAINIVSADSMRVKEILTTNIAIALETGKEQINILELNNKISRLNREMIAKVKNGVETREERDEIEKKCAGIAMEIKKLEKIISDKENDERLKSISTDRLLEIFNILEKINYDVEKYDDIVVRKLIDQVKVVSEREILISFRGGIEIAQTLEGACE